MNYYNNSSRTILIFSIILFFYSFFLLSQNFFLNTGYWYDEWCTLYTADPNYDFEIFFDRLSGDEVKPYEHVPATYYLVLRLFFKIFGFTSENGRIFSLIFFILSTFSFYILLRNNLNKIQSLFISSVFFSTPLIFWMSNETRVDMFLLFFSMINCLIFLKCLNLNNKKNKFLLLFINFFTLCIYPLTFSIIISQILFSGLKKNYDLALIVLLSIILYFIFNYDYFIVKSSNFSHHFASLKLNFFIGYFFNIFFGSIFFGSIFLIFFVYFLIKNFKKFLNNDSILFSILVIATTYLMVILSSLFVVPIAAPRYIIFIIPFILIFLFLNIFIFEKKRIFVYLFFIISFINISINYNSHPIAKPKIDEMLKIVKKFNGNYIHIVPQDKLFLHYISTVKNIKNFKIIYEDNIKDEKILSFTLICLNNPKFAFGDHNMKINSLCLNTYLNYNEERMIIFDDFVIRNFKKN